MSNGPWTDEENDLIVADYFAMPADGRLADILGCAEGAALFAIDRTTWAGATPITAVRLTYAPGYRMVTAI